MRAELYQIELIEQFLEGKLTGDDLLIFQGKMNSDPVFKQKVEIQRGLNHRIKHLALKDAIQAGHQNFIQNEDKRGWGPGKWGLMLALLAVVTLGGIWGVSAMQQEASPMITETSVSLENPEILMVNELPAPPEIGTAQSVAQVAQPMVPPSSGAFPKHLQTPFSTLTLMAEKGRSFTYKRSGTRIAIPPNTFIDKNGKPVTGKVKLKYREFRDQADIAFSGIPMFHGRDQFVSSGMFEIRAEQNGQPLEVAPTKSILVDLKLTEKIPGTRFYRLDDDSQKWEELGRLSFEEPKELVVFSDAEANDIAPTTLMEESQFKMVDKEAEVNSENLQNTLRSIGYPPILKEAGVEGKVFVRIRVNAQGIMDSAVVVRSSHPLFSKAVLEEIGNLSGFTPARLKGKPITTWITIPVQFSLDGGDSRAGRPVTYREAVPVREVATMDPSSQIPTQTSTSTPRTPLDAMPDPKNPNALIYSVNDNMVARILIRSMGAHNPDYPAPPPVMYWLQDRNPLPTQNDRLQIVANYMDTEGNYIRNGTVLSVVDLEANSAFAFRPRYFSWTTEGKNALVLYTQDEKLYGMKNATLEANNFIAPGSFRFVMEEITDEVQTREELRAWLAGRFGE